MCSLFVVYSSSIVELATKVAALLNCQVPPLSLTEPAAARLENGRYKVFVSIGGEQQERSATFCAVSAAVHDIIDRYEDVRTRGVVGSGRFLNSKVQQCRTAKQTITGPTATGK